VSQLERSTLELSCELREAQAEVGRLEEEQAGLEAAVEEQVQRTQKVEVRAIEAQQSLEAEKKKLASEDQKSQACHHQLTLLQRTLTEAHLAKEAEAGRLKAEIASLREQAARIEARQRGWVAGVAADAEALGEAFAPFFPGGGDGGGDGDGGTAGSPREGLPGTLSPAVFPDAVFERLRSIRDTTDDFGMLRTYLNGAPAPAAATREPHLTSFSGLARPVMSSLRKLAIPGP